MVPTAGQPGRVGALVLALAGLAVHAASLYGAIERHAFVHTATRVEGVVSGLNAGGSHPQITITVDGRALSFPQGGLIFGYRTGDKVKVLFDPADPAGTGVVDAVGTIWFAPLMLGGIGLLLLAAAVGTWMRSADGL